VTESGAGSLEPINPNKGKWTDNLGGQELGELRALATDINKAIDQTVKQVARGKIRVGKLLIEARAVFAGDLEFGKWRMEHTMVQSKQHANYLMKVADRFGDAPKLIDGVNYSVLQELVLAEDKDIKWIEAKIDAGEDLPTVTEVRHKVKETQASRLAPTGTSKKGQTISAGPTASPNAAINSVVVMSLTLRIREVQNRPIDGVEGALIVLGMDPDPQTPCHPDTLTTIAKGWHERARNSEEDLAVSLALEVIQTEFENWGST